MYQPQFVEGRELHASRVQRDDVINRWCTGRAGRRVRVEDAAAQLAMPVGARLKLWAQRADVRLPGAASPARSGCVVRRAHGWGSRSV